MIPLSLQTLTDAELEVLTDAELEALPDESPRRRADQLALLRTGAAALDDAQPDPDASLGGLRSGTRAGGLAALLTDPIPNVRVEFVAGANGAGTGSIAAASAGSLTWTPPGGSPGAAVAVAEGETARLEGGGEPGKFVLASRTTAADLGGICTVDLVPTFNDEVGQANGQVPAGVTYRCLCLKNAPGATVRNLKVWLGACDHAVAIGKESPATQPDGAFQTIANEATAPTGVSFVAPTSAGHVDVVTVTQLAPYEQVAIWVKRDLSAAAAAARAQLALAWSFDVVG